MESHSIRTLYDCRCHVTVIFDCFRLRIFHHLTYMPCPWFVPKKFLWYRYCRLLEFFHFPKAFPMSPHRLDSQQIAELRDAVLADRIRQSFCSEWGGLLFRVRKIDEWTVHAYFHVPKRGVAWLLFRAYGSKKPFLMPERQKELAEYIDTNLILTTKEIVA